MTYWKRTKSYASTGFTAFTEAVFEYDTPKIVHIKNKKVGLVNRLVQMIIVGYIVIFAIVIDQGYNEFEDVLSTVTTKVVGLDYTNGTGMFENAGFRVWDSSDYVVPPQSPNSVFIMTNMWITNQTQTICGYPDRHCTRNDMCRAGNVTEYGALTGSCDNSTSQCAMLGWCPIENENDNITDLGPKLQRAENFTIFIKNSIQFPSLAPSFRRRNVGENIDGSCLFDFDDNYFCPIISVGAIISMLEHPYSFEDLAIRGAVLGLQIEWDCNLNRAPSHCMPKYSARRLDDPNAQFSKGFNFRFANTWIYENGTLGRQLIKAYGIRINILVTGQGGKFSFSNLALAIGSGIALLALATVISDIFILYVLRQRNYYRKKKYQNVEGGASFFREDTVVVDPKEIPPTPTTPTETDQLLKFERSTDGETTDNETSTSVNKRQKNHHRRYS